MRFGGASYETRRPASGLWPADSLAVNNLTGRLGAVIRLDGAWRVHAHYSRSFRAPSVTDLGTVGLQGNGAFEADYADLAGLAATIGDRADDRAISTGAPVGRVRSERSDNFDLGFQFGSRRARFELTAFRIDLRDAIVSQTLILSVGAVGQFLGDQMVTRQLASGAVFAPSSAPDIEGGTPPLTINLRLRFSPGGKRYWAEGYSTLADRRTGATRSRANIAAFFANGAVGHGLVVNGILIPSGENLAQVQNRVIRLRCSRRCLDMGYSARGRDGGRRNAATFSLTAPMFSTSCTGGELGRRWSGAGGHGTVFAALLACGKVVPGTTFPQGEMM